MPKLRQLHSMLISLIKHKSIISFQLAALLQLIINHPITITRHSWNESHLYHILKFCKKTYIVILNSKSFRILNMLKPKYLNFKIIYLRPKILNNSKCQIIVLLYEVKACLMISCVI